MSPMIPPMRALVFRKRDPRKRLLSKMVMFNHLIAEELVATLKQESYEVPESEGAEKVLAVYGTCHLRTDEKRSLGSVTAGAYIGKVDLSAGAPTYLTHSTSMPIVYSGSVWYGNAAHSEVNVHMGTRTGSHFWPSVIPVDEDSGKFMFTLGVLTCTGLGLTKVGKADFHLRFLIFRRRDDPVVKKLPFTIVRREVR